jgi:hypothetical protein
MVTSLRQHSLGRARRSYFEKLRVRLRELQCKPLCRSTTGRPTFPPSPIRILHYDSASDELTGLESRRWTRQPAQITAVLVAGQSEKYCICLLLVRAKPGCAYPLLAKRPARTAILWLGTCRCPRYWYVLLTSVLKLARAKDIILQ